MTNKTKCSQCGKEKFANPKAYEARIKKYGSLEEVEKKWICRECVSLTNEEVNDVLSDQLGTDIAEDNKTKDDLDNAKIDSKIYGPNDVQ